MGGPVEERLEYEYQDGEQGQDFSPKINPCAGVECDGYPGCMRYKKHKSRRGQVKFPVPSVIRQSGWYEGFIQSAWPGFEVLIVILLSPRVAVRLEFLHRRESGPR